MQATESFFDNLVVSGLGMVSSVGTSAQQTFTSTRAGISGVTELPEIYFCLPDDPDFEDGEPLFAASLSYFDQQRSEMSEPAQWLGFVAAQAFRDLVTNAGIESDDLSKVGLMMSLPPARPNWGPAHEEDFVYHFHNYACKDISSSQQFSYTGHTGETSLIRSAYQKLVEGEVSSVAIGGVESYLFPQWLALYDKNYRIKSSRNLDGFIPGEGAAFLLLELDGKPQQAGRKNLAFLRGTAMNLTSDSDRTLCTGVGLSTILATLLDRVQKQPAIVCDINGETGRAKEWGHALARLGNRLKMPLALEHPVSSLGDVGAASVSFLSGLTIKFLQKKYPRHTDAIVWSGSDSGERGALWITRSA